MKKQSPSPSTPKDSHQDSLPITGQNTGSPDRRITKKQIAVVLLAVLLSALVLFTVYSIIDQKHPGQIDSKEEYLGNIETPAKLWFNGYLGILFRFRQLGNINWLILPLLIWFFLSKRINRERWQLALVFVWLLTLLFLGIKGYYNFRYQMTLFPVTSAMVLFLLWKLLEDKHRVLKILCFSLVAVMCVFNIYHYRDQYKTYWDLRVSVKDPHFPYRLVDYLKSDGALAVKRRVLTLNQPIFYYHTNLPGVDYIGPNAIQTWVDFKKKSGPLESRAKLFKLIKQKLRVDYILLNTVQQRFQRDEMLEEFLHCECRLVVEDQGWLLYRLRENPLEKLLNSPAFREVYFATKRVAPATQGGTDVPSFAALIWASRLLVIPSGFPINSWPKNIKWPDSITEGAFRKGVGGDKNLKLKVWDSSRDTVDTISPSLLRFSKVGKYHYSVGNKGNNSTIVVRLNQSQIDDTLRLQFGYEFNRKGLDIDAGLYEGKYVTVIARLAVTPSLLNRDNYIAIVDYNTDGSRSAEKTYFNSPHWRTYMVTKKVSPGNKRLLMMMRFCPRNKKDRFKIKDIKIIVSKEPL